MSLFTSRGKAASLLPSFSLLFFSTFSPISFSSFFLSRCACVSKPASVLFSPLFSARYLHLRLSRGSCYLWSSLVVLWILSSGLRAAIALQCRHGGVAAPAPSRRRAQRLPPPPLLLQLLALRLELPCWSVAPRRIAVTHPHFLSPLSPL